MALRFGFVGFRHGHIYSLVKKVEETDGVEMVAACEEDAEARAEAIEKGVEMTHDSAEDLVANADCDVIATGGYFAGRGAVLRSSRRAIQIQQAADEGLREVGFE